MAQIQISSGRGPVECELAVGLFLAWLLARHPGAKVAIEPRSKLVQVGNRNYSAYKSVVVDLPKGQTTQEGVVQWICSSPVRPEHKRKNWFIEVRSLPDADALPHIDASGLDPNHPDKRLIRVETFRSPGKGGQNVNKVETGARVTHLPTGLTAQSVTARTQAANKKIALSRLQETIQTENARQEDSMAEAAWRQHDQLERGNAFLVFVGLDFKPTKP